MSTWEQRMAQRPYVRGTKRQRDGAEYQRARLYAMINAANHARGPQPHGLASCCWRDVWMDGFWGVHQICTTSIYRHDSKPICDHTHHEEEGPWMAPLAQSQVPNIAATDSYMGLCTSSTETWFYLQ